jgi:CubicO group peptidase (beta-lactamase class C family)
MRIRRLGTRFLFLLGLAAQLTARPALPQASDPRAAQAHALFAPMAGTTVPGCAVGVRQDGRFLHRKGYGMADLERGAPITTETAFYVGSVAKQFTAMSVALLQRDGVVSLDDSARRWIPEIPEAGAAITVRHLILHQSGLREHYDLLALLGWRMGDPVGQEDVLRLVRGQRELNFRPGDEHLYNNTGYNLLAVLVGRAGGTTLRQFAEARIFRPLGMARTQYLDDRTLLVPGRASAYSVEQGKIRLDQPNVETVGAGGLWSTVDDLARWDESITTAALGGEDLVREVQTPGRLNDGTRIPYAFGLDVDTWRGLRRVHHDGSLAGFRASLTRFPEQRFSTILLCNFAQARPSEYAERLAELFLGDQLGPASVAVAEPTRPAVRTGGEPPDTSRAALAGLAGLYTSVELGLTWTIVVTDSGLAGRGARDREFGLRPLFRDVFSTPFGTIRFERDERGSARRLLVSTDRSRNIRFEQDQSPTRNPR